MKKLLIAGAIASLPLMLAATAVALYLIFTGPRMKDQASIREYEAPLPALPMDSVPVHSPPGPSGLEALGVEEPALPATEENLAAGRTYYGYYCVFCHGDTGDGEGPVGQSYVPAPGDFADMDIQAMTDRDLVRAMLTGTGHEPLLERIVPEKARPLLVLHVRSLARGEGRE